MANIKKSAISTLSMTVSASVRIKSHLSSLHIQSAAYFARQSASCEQKKTVTENLRSKHRSYVTGAIILSVASLEATINELFLETVNGNKDIFNNLQSNVPNILCELWRQADRFSIL